MTQPKDDAPPKPDEVGEPGDALDEAPVPHPPRPRIHYNPPRPQIPRPPRPKSDPPPN